MTFVNARRDLPPWLLQSLRLHVPHGGIVYVPVKVRANVNTQRDSAIRRARAAGASIPDLARRYHLGESRTWEICAGIHVGRRGGRRRG